MLARLVTLSAVAGLGIAAPEALAIPIAGVSNGWGGVLMAAPIVGAIVGIVVIGRRDVHQQNRLDRAPRAVDAPAAARSRRCAPSTWVVAFLFFASGTLQAFMVPLQATFALVTEPALRGRIFSLAGCVSIAAAGAVLPRRRLARPAHEPARGVAVCAAVSLVLIAAIAAHAGPTNGSHGGRPRLRDDVLPRGLSETADSGRGGAATSGVRCAGGTALATASPAQVESAREQRHGDESGSHAQRSGASSPAPAATPE